MAELPACSYPSDLVGFVCKDRKETGLSREERQSARGHLVSQHHRVAKTPFSVKRKTLCKFLKLPKNSSTTSHLIPPHFRIRFVTASTVFHDYVLRSSKMGNKEIAHGVIKTSQRTR